MYAMYLTIFLISSGQPLTNPLIFTQFTDSPAKCREVARKIVADTKVNLPHNIDVKSHNVSCKFIRNK